MKSHAAVDTSRDIATPIAMRSKRERASSPSPRKLPGSANDDDDKDATAKTRRRRVDEKVHFNDDAEDNFFIDDARANRACETSTIEVTRERGTSTITRCYARYPVKVLTPRGGLEAGSDCAWAYSVSMGGGLVSGDESGMRVVVGDSCGLVLATQGTQKVYKRKGGVTYDDDGEGMIETKEGQTGETIAALRARVGSGGLLAVLPDPTQIFRDAVFRQTQVIDLARDASCVIVDWLTAGRIGYGNERWAFEEADVRTRVRVDGQVVVVEAMRLSGREDDVIGGESLADRMGSINVFASLVMLGPRVESLGADCLAWARAKAKRAMAERGAAWVRDPEAKDGFFVSGSEIPARANEHGRGIVLRFFATDAERVNDALREILAPLSEQLGAPPYDERGGS